MYTRCDDCYEVSTLNFALSNALTNKSLFLTEEQNVNMHRKLLFVCSTMIVVCKLN